MLPYYEVHDGDGPYLLMVHGVLSSRAQWMDNLSALQAVCQPVILELYGHGRSPSPSESIPYSPGGYCQAFEDIRTRLGAERWHVLGYSLGAGLTIRYALEHADRVISSSFTNSTSAFAEAGTRAEFRDNADSIIERYEQEGMAAIDAIPVHPRHAKKLPEPVKSALLEDCKLLNPAGVARTIVHTNGYSSVRDRVQENRTPSLLLYGEKESRFAPLKAFVVEHMPYLEHVTLPAGHAVNAEAADEFNKALTAFLVKHK